MKCAVVFAALLCLPASAQESELGKRLSDRIAKEIEESYKRLRVEIQKIITAEVATAQAPKPKPKTFDQLVDEVAKLLTEDGINGRLKKFLATPAGKKMAKEMMEEQKLDKVDDAIDMYFDKAKDGRLTIKEEFADPLTAMLDGIEKPPKEAPVKPPPPPPPAVKKAAWLGFTPDDLTDERRKELGITSPNGIKIFDVRKGGPAEKSGLKGGDIMLSINGKALTDDTLGDILKTFAPGDEVDVVYFRGAERKSLKVKLGEKP